MAGFITGHQLEQCGDILIAAAPFHLFVENTAREFGRAGGNEEINEFLFQLWLHPIPVDVIPIFVFLEMALIGVGFHLINQLIPIAAD